MYTSMSGITCRQSTGAYGDNTETVTCLSNNGIVGSNPAQDIDMY